MLMMLMETVPPRLRGELTRWLSPLTARVYVGRASPVVRDLLWLKAVKECGSGRVMQAWSAPAKERGFEFRMHGFAGSQIIDLDGLSFLSVKDAAWDEASKKFRLGDRDGA